MPIVSGGNFRQRLARWLMSTANDDPEPDAWGGRSHDRGSAPAYTTSPYAPPGQNGPNEGPPGHTSPGGRGNEGASGQAGQGRGTNEKASGHAVPGHMAGNQAAGQFGWPTAGSFPMAGPGSTTGTHASSAGHGGSTGQGSPSGQGFSGDQGSAGQGNTGKVWSVEPGQDFGQAPGSGPAADAGSGSETGTAYGTGQEHDGGPEHGTGPMPAVDPAHAFGQAPGSGQGSAFGQGAGFGQDTDSGQGPGFGPGAGSSQGSGFGPGAGDGSGFGQGAGARHGGSGPDSGLAHGASKNSLFASAQGQGPKRTAPGRTQTASQDAWPEVCERFALQMLAHAEYLRPALDRLESDEDDEERLQWLYEVDHSVTRMRRAARDLRILAGMDEAELGDGYTSSLVDVIRAAESAIEHYPRVTIGRMAELAVVPYAADDMSSLLAALLDNATNYSPSTVTVSGHLLDSGGVMLRVEDTGIGIPAPQLQTLNAALAGPVPKVNDRTGKHTGFPVVHRLAHRHGVTVRFASRPHSRTGAPSGTVAMVTIPPDLLCEVPDDRPPITAPEPGAHRRDTSYAGPPKVSSGHLSVARSPAEPQPEKDEKDENSLPRRTRTSLRGGEGKHANGRNRTRDTAAVARSFADDVSAFTLGQQSAKKGDDPEGRKQ